MRKNSFKNLILYFNKGHFLIIRQIFKYATTQIKIPGCDVVPFPMFNVLDGTNTNDYVQRVEPSSDGGLKLANAFYKCCFENIIP